MKEANFSYGSELLRRTPRRRALRCRRREGPARGRDTHLRALPGAEGRTRRAPGQRPAPCGASVRPALGRRRPRRPPLAASANIRRAGTLRRRTEPRISNPHKTLTGHEALGRVRFPATRRDHALTGFPKDGPRSRRRSVISLPFLTRR